MIKILAIGLRHDKDLVASIENYQKRLRAPYNITWQLLANSKKQNNEARIDETDQLMKQIKDDETVILLDERGIMISSVQLAQALNISFNQSKKITVVIGGAYGVSPALHSRAQHVVALSRLVFPHQIVRLLVAEQLYRAQEINFGGMYHHR